MANKTLLVAQREYLDNVRTKTFWIGILAFPVILVISIAAGWVLNKFKETKVYAVVDLSEQQLGDRIESTAREPDQLALLRLLAKPDLREQLVGPLRDLQQRHAAELERLQPDAKDIPAGLREAMAEVLLQMPATDVEKLQAAGVDFESARKYQLVGLDELQLQGMPVEQQQQQLGQLVSNGRLFAYFVIGEHPERSLDDFRYVSNNSTDNDLRNWYANAATKVVQGLRIEDAGIDKALAQQLQERVTFKEQQADATGKTRDTTVADKANKYAPVGFVYLLWIAVFTAAQMLLTNTVEEKSNRIIEVLLSSVSPGQLMSGKIWGIGATGLTIVGSWVACALLGVFLAPRLIDGFDFPLMAVIGDPLYLISFVGYFLGGYLLYAAILVGLGSVTNSLKEAQNLLQPVFILLIVPLVSMMFIVQEPNGTVAKVLSYVPLFTPFTMMNRAGGPPSALEYAVTGALLLASIWIAFRLSGKIFRIGILMTGKPPKLKEIFGWLRAS